MVYPNLENVLALYNRNTAVMSDKAAYEAVLTDYFNAVTYEKKIESDDADWDNEFERVSHIHTHSKGCSGGELYEVQETFINSDNPEFVAWKYQDEMRPGSIDKSECDPFWGSRYNRESYRRMEYHDANLHQWGPDSTEGQQSVSVGISADGPEASWEYQIPDVVVTNNTGSTNIVSWEHDINSGQPRNESYTTRPGVVVNYPVEQSLVEYGYDIEFNFGGGWGTNSWIIEADGSGATLLTN